MIAGYLRAVQHHFHEQFGGFSSCVHFLFLLFCNEKGRLQCNRPNSDYFISLVGSAVYRVVLGQEIQTVLVHADPLGFGMLRQGLMQALGNP